MQKLLTFKVCPSVQFKLLCSLLIQGAKYHKRWNDRNWNWQLSEDKKVFSDFRCL